MSERYIGVTRDPEAIIHYGRPGMKKGLSIYHPGEYQPYGKRARNDVGSQQPVTFTPEQKAQQAQTREDSERRAQQIRQQAAQAARSAWNTISSAARGTGSAISDQIARNRAEKQRQHELRKWKSGRGMQDYLALREKNDAAVKRQQENPNAYQRAKRAVEDTKRNVKNQYRIRSSQVRNLGKDIVTSAKKYGADEAYKDAKTAAKKAAESAKKKAASANNLAKNYATAAKETYAPVINSAAKKAASATEAAKKAVKEWRKKGNKR